MSGVRVPHCPPKIHCNPKIKASGWSLPPAQTQSNGLCCPAGQFLYISDRADGLHICPVFTAGGPVLREANSQQKLGGPGLDFQTWDSTNPSHTRITPERRSVDQFYSLIPPGLPRFAEYSCKKAHTPYRPNSTHREAEHDKNPQHHTKSNPRIAHEPENRSENRPF